MVTQFIQLMRKLRDLGDAIRSRVYVDDRLTLDQMKTHAETLIKTDRTECMMAGSLIGRTLYGYRIPDGVTLIPEYFFSGCTNLRDITLPDSVSEIGAYAFGFCNNLKINDLPSNLTKLQSRAFSNCVGLTEIIFHSTPTTVNNTAFIGCNNLTSIKVPWAEGEVAGAPWGATKATITYNYTG